jgi:hypothetical protein
MINVIIKEVISFYLFLLAYIKCTRGLIVIFSHMYLMYFDFLKSTPAVQQLREWMDK